MKKQNATIRWAVHPAVRSITELDGPGVIVFGYMKESIYHIIQASNMRKHIIRLQSRDPEVEVVACLRCDRGEQGRERQRLSYRYRKNRDADGWLAFSPHEITGLCREIEGAVPRLAWEAANAQTEAARNAQKAMGQRTEFIRRLRVTGDFVSACAKRECEFAQHIWPRPFEAEQWIKLVEDFHAAAKRFTEASVELASAIELVNTQEPAR